MKIRNLVAYITLLLVLAGFITACSGNSQQAAPLVYTDIATKIQVYEDSYREFVNSGNGEVALVTATSVTPLGAPCNSKYTISSDGLYESCSLVVQRDVEQYDEYFNIGDGLMMFVRTYFDEEGVPHINKYISTGAAVYYVNSETSTLEPVEDINSLDCFVTFDQVRRAYAGTADSTSETQVSA